VQRAQTNTLDDALMRLGSRVTSWVLGAGLLSLHATVFSLTMVGLVMWNVYDDPTDLWVGDVFRRWGALLVFHAIAVAAGLTAWKLMRAEKQALDTAGDFRPVAPVYQIGAQPSSAATATWAQQTAPMAVNQPSSRARVVGKQVVVTWVEWSNALGHHAMKPKEESTSRKKQKET